MITELKDIELLENEENQAWSDGVSGVIAGRLITELGIYNKRARTGWVFGSETDFVLGKKIDGSDLPRRPDAAFCLKTTTLPIPPRAIVPTPPDIAIEVASSRDEIDDTDKKLREYRKVKIKLIWVIRPLQEVVEVYRDGKPDGLLGIDEELNGSPVIPDFKLPVRDLFDGLAVQV